MKKLLFTIAVVMLLAVISGLASYYLATEQTLEFALKVERRLSKLDRHRAVFADLEIMYLERPGPGPVLLLLHGFIGDKDNWTRYVRYLPDDYHILIPDIPGFGENPRNPNQQHTIEIQSQRMFSFIEYFDIDKFHVAGNSMGGHIAALMTLRHPERILSLALLDTAGIEAPVTTQFVEQAIKGESLLLIERPADYHKVLELAFQDPPFLPARFRKILATRLTHDRAFFQGIFQELIDNYIPLEDSLAQIATPTLILWGKDDRVFHHSAAQVLADGIPNSRLVILDDTGHVPMLERPKESAAHYVDFLASATTTQD